MSNHETHGIHEMDENRILFSLPKIMQDLFADATLRSSGASSLRSTRLSCIFMP